MTKALWFDMDGTIADLYGVKDWLPKLNASDPSPYIEARPLVNMSRLARLLHKVQRNGYTINIISWTSKTGSPSYNETVALAKMEWLSRHLPSVEWSTIHIVAYGTPKSTVGRGYLFDDEEKNRTEWGEGAHSPNEIFSVLNLLP
jgi:5'(3')-deoxyribonucleotidase